MRDAESLSDLNHIRKIPEQLREVHNELLENGHPGLARKLTDIASQIDSYLLLRTLGNNTTEVARLRTIIKSALPHQTNVEVGRWLEAALSYGTPVYQNGGGKRVDV